ncbi:tRNA intron endonuclease [Pisolithus marmoratus]|nr:tRNA intron endonuclease [Pisolithus marmoratus]
MSAFTTMQTHPSYPGLTRYLSKYPSLAGALFQTFNDITLVQKWTNVELVDLPNCQRAAIKGLRPSSDGDEPPSMCVVLPCSLAESLSTSYFGAAFASLGERTPKQIYLAICADDSSTVYYKISKGIVKPSI